VNVQPFLPGMDGPIRIRGAVSDLRLAPDSNNYWGRARVTDDSLGKIVVIGTWLGVSDGDHVRIKGVWDEHPRWGMRLKAIEIEVEFPMSDVGVVGWLIAKLPGVGPATARALLDWAGGADKLWAIIEDSPERLTEVKGITDEKAATIAHAYRQSLEYREHIIQLKAWGLTEKQIVAVLQEWKHDCVNRLRENPYQLEQLKGFGFKRADEIALRMGIPHDAPVRARAAVRWCFTEAMRNGHCYVQRDTAVHWVATRAELPPSRAEAAVGTLTQWGELEFYRGSENAALNFIAFKEQRVARRVAELTRNARVVACLPGTRCGVCMRCLAGRDGD